MSKRNKKLNLKGLTRDQIASLFSSELKKKATPAELRFKKWLDRFGVKYEFQKQWIIQDKIFISDFYLPQFMITIEIDGGYHIKPRQRLVDAQKSGFLAKDNVNTVRLTNARVLAMDYVDFTTFIAKIANKTVTN